MSPHSGVGSWAPRPRKEIAAAVRSTPLASSEIWTISGVRELGRTCRSRIRQRDRPRALQALMYAVPEIEAAWPMASRAYHGHQVAAIARIMLRTLGPKTKAIASA